LNEQNLQGNTALHLAIIHEHPNILRLLVENEASMLVVNAEGNFPLYEALYKDMQTVQYLLPSLAPIRALGSAQFDVVHLAAQLTSTEMLHYFCKENLVLYCNFPDN